jgi:hypothetical protein
MTKAVLRGGVIQPLEPLPPDWKEGQELIVESVGGASADDATVIDRWFDELEAAAASIHPEEAARLEAALRDADQLAKARRDPPLPAAGPAAKTP